MLAEKFSQEDEFDQVEELRLFPWLVQNHKAEKKAASPSKFAISQS